ncbi:MAG: hypothetical protein MUO90_02520 [Dehalococcoidales bacterium]|nr:hypothetical protein [Dehalococcoidales bacterium]
MSEKRMLILPAELVKKMNDNRGDLSQAEFIDFLLEDRLEGKTKEQKEITREEFESLRRDIKQILLKEAAEKGRYATKEELQVFQEDAKKLIKSFLDFFIGYGLELSKQPAGDELKELVRKLDSLEDGLPTEDEGGEVKIKWK